jgi:hypothetical protein
MIDGKPGMIISPVCKVLRKGLSGGFSYKRVQVASQERYHDKPDKNRYSHVCEAAEYMCLVAGEGDQLVKSKPPDNVDESDWELNIHVDRGDSGQSFGWMG